MTSLIDDNLDLVFDAAKYVTGRHWQDYITSGYIGLLDAASKFKTDSGATFRTYAKRRIEGAIKDDRRTILGRRHKKGQAPPREPLTDFISAKPMLNPVDEADEVDAIASGLLPRHRMTISMLADGYTKADVARATGFSESLVNQDCRRVIAPRLKARAG